MDITKKGTNVLELRVSNALLILNIIRKTPSSRAEIAKKTGLSRAGITIIVDDLIQRGLIEEESQPCSKPGKKALKLNIHPDSAFIIGVHLRSEEFSIGLFNFKGELLQQETQPYNNSLMSVAQLIDIGNRILAMVDINSIEKNKVIGVGICASGPVDVNNGKVLRASSRALYEKLNGSCKNFNNFVFFKVNDAVGGAVVLKGEVLSGQQKFGNEFGHMSIRYDGERCECGNCGCLNMYASIPSIIRQFPALNASSWNDIVGSRIPIRWHHQSLQYI